jgi:peptide/nickel transport system substrate-binding protein
MKDNLHRGVGLFLAVIMLAAMLAGCAGSPPAPAGDPAAQSTTTDGGSTGAKKDTLVVGIPWDPPTLDPHASSTTPSVNNLTPVYETLVIYDENQKIKPLLAESWEQIDDLHWQFNLRKGVKFHNGEELKASDVVYSMTRATGPKGANVSYIMRAVDPTETKVVDDYTVIIGTHAPFTPLIGYLPYIGAAIISEKEFSADDDKAAQNPVGTGPFKFVSWTKNDRAVYERNDDYWGEAPAYKNLIIRTIVEANSRVIELESGNIDIAYAIPAKDVARLESNPDTKIERNDSTLFEYIGMNTEKEPFNNPEFRKAIDLAIDEQAVVDSVYLGNARYTPTSVTPNMPYYNDEDVTARYDPEEAKAILKKLGIKEGTTFRFTIYDDQFKIDAATVIQSMLNAVGLNIEIQVLEQATFWTTVESGDSEMFISAWGAVGFPEPDNNLFGPFHSVQIPNGNICRWRNAEFDQTMDASRAAPEGPERGALIKRAQEILRAEVPAMTYSNVQQIVGTRANVLGFKPTAAESHFVKDVYFK